MTYFIIFVLKKLEKNPIGVFFNIKWFYFWAYYIKVYYLIMDTEIEELIKHYLKKGRNIKSFEKSKQLIENTFNENSDTLPKIENFDPKVLMISLFSLDLDFMYAYVFKHLYQMHSYFILNHQLLTGIKHFIEDKNFKHITELSAGVGWFSTWLRKYDINVKDVIDNKSWTLKYLPVVTKYDSVQYVKENPNIELFILSWPYMDDVAFNIWKSMRQNQYLLYIGEIGGCTANDDFFNSVDTCEIDDIWNLNDSFLSFLHIYDKIKIYRK